MSSVNKTNKVKLDFEYNNEVYNFEAEPFKTLNEMKEQVIRKIYRVPKGIHCYYKNRDLNPYLFERIETLFPRKKKVLIKLKEPQNQKPQAAFAFLNTFNGIDGNIINISDNNINKTKTSMDKKKGLMPSFFRKSLLGENNFQYDVNSLYNNYVNDSNNLNNMNNVNNISDMYSMNNMNHINNINNMNNINIANSMNNLNNMDNINNIHNRNNQNINSNSYTIPNNRLVRNCADEFISNNFREFNTISNNSNLQQVNKSKFSNNLNTIVNDRNHNFSSNHYNTHVVTKINNESNNFNSIDIEKNLENNHDDPDNINLNIIKPNKTDNKNEEKLKKLYLKCHICSQNVLSHFCRNCFIFICESCKLKCEGKSHKIMRINISNPNFFSNVDEYVQQIFDEMEEKRNIVSSTITALNPQAKVKGKNKNKDKDKKNSITNIDIVLKKLVKMINKLSYLYKEIMGILSTINLKKADQVEEDFNEEVSDLKDNINEISSKAEINLANFNAFPTIHDQYTAMKFYFRKIHEQENKYINDICPKVKIYTLGHEINKNVTEGCEKMETILEELIDNDNTFGLDKYYVKEYKDLVKDCELNLGLKRPQIGKYSLNKGNKKDNLLMITNVYSNLYTQRLSIGGKNEKANVEEEEIIEKNGGNE